MTFARTVLVFNVNVSSTNGLELKMTFARTVLVFNVNVSSTNGLELKSRQSITLAKTMAMLSISPKFV